MVDVMIELRQFKDVTFHELEKTCYETLYYYLLSDIVESYKANDKEALDKALEIAKESWENQEELTLKIQQIVQRNVDPEESYEDFEDSLFQATENTIY